MTIVNKPKVKQKKHGKKVFVKPSQKKAVKNGRAQPKPKVKKAAKKVKEVTSAEQEYLDELDARIESEVEAEFDNMGEWFTDEMDETEDNL